MIDHRPLIAHVVYRFNVGGLENGVVNLINNMPEECYRHAVISLTDITDFRNRIRRKNVEFVALNKPAGHALRIYPRLHSLFRSMRPAIVHSRNLAALEVSAPAWAAGVPVRIHGEHGRDVGDLDGSNRKYRWVRRLYSPFVTHYVALSRDLEGYLVGKVGIAKTRVTQLYNGVDIALFHPANGARVPISGCPFTGEALFLVGTVGRMEPVKDQTNLAAAFIEAVRRAPELRGRLRLVMVGDGPLRVAASTILRQAGMADLAWLTGERSDIPDVLRGLDCFVLPSLAEGISNTILEAMACGLPVVATDVGGNKELLDSGTTGELVPAADPVRLAQAIRAYVANPSAAAAAGRAGRALVERRFSLESMTCAYRSLYDRLLGGHGQSVRAAGAAR